jgi:ATP/maltotriose-dependent transcriptional regulator MalT
MTDDRHVSAGRDITGTVITGDVQELHLTLPQLPEIPAPEPNRPPETTGFVGRDDELAFYKQKLDSGHLAVISGMAGVGKTALAANLALQFAPLDQIFWHAFHEEEGIEVLIWKLAGFLAWNGQDELWQMLQGARITGGQPPPSETLLDYLLKMIRGRGYLLCLDDFQFVDDDPLLNQLVERLRSALLEGDLAIIITTRRTPGFINTAEFTTLVGLSPVDAKQMVEARGLVLELEQVDALHKLTAGNAQFLNMAIHALQHAKDRELVLRNMAETEDIERYLMNEVDEHLTEVERRVLEAAAVLLGYPGTVDAIEFVLEGSNVRRTLRELCDRFLLIPSRAENGREYTQHALLQAFYYQLMSRDQREEMHCRAGEFYEKAELDPLRAGLHYERAREYHRAARLITANTWELINRGQARAVQHLLERFSEDHLDPLEWVEVNLAHGESCALIGEGQLAVQSYREAISKLESMADSNSVRELEARACRGIGELLQQETPGEALEWLQRGLGAVEEGNIIQEATLKIKIGAFHYNLGSYDEALDYLEDGLKILPRDAAQLRALALKNIGAIYIYKGNLAEAKEYTHQALKIALQLRDFFQQIDLLSNLGICKIYTSDWYGAIEDLQRAIDLAERLDSEPYLIAPQCNLGAAYVYTGDDEKALSHLNNALKLARRNNSQVYESTIQFHLADLHIRNGHWSEASDPLGEAERLALEIGIEGNLPEIYGAWAEIKLGEEDYPAALEYAQRSLEKARELGEEIEQGISLRTLGQVLFYLGEHKQAIGRFEESLSVLGGQEPYEAARTKALMGRTLLDISEQLSGKKLLEEARSTFKELGAKRNLIRLEKFL